LYIYLEYVSGGSIHKLLQEYGAFQEPVVRKYTRQILCGLAYLHNQNTVHRYFFGLKIYLLKFSYFAGSVCYVWFRLDAVVIMDLL
jgi:hypothetical protein